MPTTPQEVIALTSIINRHIDPSVSEKLFPELYEKVGETTDNRSVKLSLLMLKVLYDPKMGDTLQKRMIHLGPIFASYELPPEPEPQQHKLFRDVHVFGKTAVAAIVFLHASIILGLIASIFILPFGAPWYITLPLMIYILNLIFAPPGGCVATRVEDCLRRWLGLKEIKKFVKHYTTLLKGRS